MFNPAEWIHMSVESNTDKRGPQSPEEGFFHPGDGRVWSVAEFNSAFREWKAEHPVAFAAMRDAGGMAARWICNCAGPFPSMVAFAAAIEDVGDNGDDAAPHNIEIMAVASETRHWM